MKTIKLAGKFSHLECILDDDWAQMFEDGGIVISFGSGGCGGYAFVHSTGLDKKSIKERVHWIISNHKSTKQLVVDHINGNRLDNTSKNLRIVSQKINANNQNNKLRSRNKSGIRGMHFRKTRNTWAVQMESDGICIYSKTFKNHDDAVLVAKFNNHLREL